MTLHPQDLIDYLHRHPCRHEFIERDLCAPRRAMTHPTNLPTDAIEECIDYMHSEHGDSSDAKVQLRALKDAALVARAFFGNVHPRIEQIGPVRSSVGDMHTTLGFTVEGAAVRFEAPIVNGLPQLDDAARRALGEQA